MLARLVVPAPNLWNPARRARHTVITLDEHRAIEVAIRKSGPSRLRARALVGLRGPARPGRSLVAGRRWTADHLKSNHPGPI